MIGPSFEAVLAAAADGDELAFGALWRDLQPALLHYLNAFAPGSGEDLASETWLRIVKGLATFSGDERAFRAWVFTVARHRAVDRWRRTTRRDDELVPLDALTHLPAPDDPATASSPASTSPRSPPSPANAPATSGVLAHRALRRLAAHLAHEVQVRGRV
jgi:RNA polymerase sigma-70 factor (ECF subfamily)